MFDETQVKKHYRLLNHAPYGVTELVAIYPAGGIAAIGYFDNEEDFDLACWYYSGKCNLYVGVNPRKKELLALAPNQMVQGLARRGKKEDIAAITAMFLDIDPVRSENCPATKEENRRALAKAQELASLPIFSGAGVCSSGNGAYVLAGLNFTDDLPTLEQKQKSLVEEIRREHFPEGGGLQLDSVHDLPRIMAVMGTLKMKGQEDATHPYRIARFLGEPPAEVCHTLEEAILSSSVTPPSSIISEARKVKRPPLLEPHPTQHGDTSLAPLCRGLQSILQTTPTIPDRSQLYLQLVAAMKERGWSREAIKNALLDLDRRLPPQSYQRLEKFGARSETAQEALLDHYLEHADASILPCSLVFKLLKSKACTEGCEYLGDRLSQGNYKISRAPNIKPSQTMSLEQAREQLKKDLEQRVETLIREKGVLILHDPPGVGKNKIASQVLKHRRMIVFTSQRSALDKFKDDLQGGLPYQEIQNKEELCLHERDITRYRDRGYPHREQEVCGQRCTNHDQCPYWMQFDRDKSWILPNKYLLTGLLQRKHNSPELVLIDENILGDLLETSKVSLNDLGVFTRFLQAQSLLSSALDQLLDATSRMMRDTFAEADPNFMISLSRQVEESAGLIRAAAASPEYRAFQELIEQEPIDRLPPGHLATLLQVMAVEASRGSKNSRISVENGNIVIRQFHNLEQLRNYPVLVLDASAKREICERIFPDREIEMLTHPVASQAEVIQITNAMLGKGQLNDTKVMDRVITFIRRHAQGRVGIICNQRYRKIFEKKIPGALVRHYWAIRGTRNFEGCDTLFLVGGPYMKPKDKVKLAEALFYDEDKISQANPKVIKNYGMSRANQQIYGLYEFSDPRLQAMVDYLETEEMRQAAFRIRPLEGEKRIYVLSNLPIGLPPTKLITLPGKNDTRQKYFDYARQLKAEGKRISNRIISEAIGITTRMGRHYWNLLPKSLKTKR